MKIVCIIPARYASTRLPGKPLALIAGKPMIQRVYEQVQKASCIDEIIVATDDSRVLKAVEAFGGRAVMTSATHPTGTDRLAEVVGPRKDIDVVINVQGDEPLIAPSVIEELSTYFQEHEDGKMATVACPLKEDEYDDPAAVKVVCNCHGEALYFSRSLIPYPRKPMKEGFLKHIGIYGYSREFLLEYATMTPTPLEEAESLEQLRVLENGYTIQVIKSPFTFIGVDTPADLEAVNRIVIQQEAEHA